MKRLDFIFWLMKRSASRYSCPRRDIRREMHQRLRCANGNGKGHRAWKRADAIEKAWRASGGFYVEDFITQ